MPVARYQLPDGRIARFEVPDGTTPEQAQSMGEQYFAQSAPQHAPINPAPGPSKEYPPTGSFAENLAAGVGESAVNTGERVSQLGWDAINGLTGNQIPAAVNAQNALQSNIDEQEHLSGPLNESAGGIIGNIAGTTAQMALPMGEAAQAMRGSNALTRLAVPGAAANELTQPTGEGRPGEVANPLVGAVGSTVGGGVAAGLRGAARAGSESINPYVIQAANYLNARGIPTSLDQVTQGEGLQFLRSLLKSVPGSGAKTFENEQKARSTEAVAGLFGEQADALTDDVLHRAQTRIGNSIAGVVPDQHNIPLEQHFYDSIRDLVAREEQSVAPNRHLIDMGERILGRTEPNPQYTQIMNQYGPQLGQRIVQQQQIPQTIVTRPPLFADDTMTGAQYRNERTDLGRKMFSAFKSGDHETGRALEAMQNALDDAANNTLTGAEQQTLNTARQQYRNLMTVVPAVKSGVKGELDIDALNASVQRRDPEAYNFGRGPNAQTAYIAKALKELTDQPASSPLWKKIAVLGPVTAGLGSVASVGGPAAAGAVALGGSNLANRLLISPGLQRYITQGAGPTTRNILEFLARGSQPAATAVTDEVADRVAQ